MSVEHQIETKAGLQTVKLTPMKAIRRKCLDCSCYQPSEVKLCPVTACALYPYRLGRKPQDKA